MFEVGSFVIYRAEGVCKITDIRNENFGIIGKEELYYILTPINDGKSTVFVPLGNEKLVGYMRKLMSADEIVRMIDEIKDRRIEWVEDSRGRNVVFREILSLGDRRELCVLALSIAEHIEEGARLGKKAGSTDLNALKRAEKMLYEEFRATTDIASSEQIIPLLRGQISLCDRES